nr:expressed protein [Hymenolepis microstoma]
MSPPIFNSTISLPLFAPTVSFPSTHTELQHSELWRRFNWQVETSRPASTPPEDIRPFPWTVTFKHTCYNCLPFRFETHSTDKNLHIWSLPPNLHPSLEHNCLVLRSNRLKDTTTILPTTTTLFRLFFEPFSSNSCPTSSETLLPWFRPNSFFLSRPIDYLS